MTLLWHELKRNKISLLIWTYFLAFMLAVCVVIYPEMEAQMGDINDMLVNMGAFSDALGIDQINFAEFMGYFAMECGEMLGLGGSIFAAILGIGMLANEEKDHTAEFLLSHPISRAKVVTEKLLAMIAQITAMNLVIFAVTAVAALIIKVDADFAKLALIFLAYYVLQIEIVAITFCISAFLKRGGFGIGLGFAFLLYFMNIVSNLVEEAEFLKFITPFGYADGSHIVNESAIEYKYLICGLAITLLCIALAYKKYTSKDIS